jgi:CarD family transcriptional regulator
MWLPAARRGIDRRPIFACRPSASICAAARRAVLVPVLTAAKQLAYHGALQRYLHGRVTEGRMFKVGEKVVYPAHGVGVIDGIQTKVISGAQKRFYMLRLLDNEMTIMIPTENVESVGLRRVIGKDMVPKVYRILRDKRVEIDQQTWNRRYREYTEKIKTGSVLEIAKVLRDLFVLKGDKELSFGERKMLDTARNLLVKELAIARSFPEEKILEELQLIFTH